jgi:vesicle coat complex subunit
MKTFNQFLEEQKQTYVVHGQYGEKFRSHEFEARSHDHAKKLFKQKAKEAGHKYPSVSSARTKEEEAEHKRKSDEHDKARSEKIKKSEAERDKDKDYWDMRQKEYDKQSYKGD